MVVGGYNRDVVLRVPRLPAPGETCLALGRSESDGGKGSNQAVAAARCGAAVAILAAVGDDAAGARALALWAAQGVDAAGVARLGDVPTGAATVLVDPAGENLIVVDPGANARLSAAHVAAQAHRLRGAALVLAQLETPADATAAAFAAARAAGVRTVLNAAPALAPGGADALLAAVDVLVVNAGEGAQLSGRTGIEEVAAALLARVGEAVVVTEGAAGATLFRRGAPPLPARPPRVEAVDTTGAGDALTGAFCARLAGGDDMAAALAWGVAAGALACTRAGAAAHALDPAAIASLLAAGAG